MEHPAARNQHPPRSRHRCQRQLQPGARRRALRRQQDTLVLAGANDLWKCSLAMGCVWRNTTNSTTCMSAQVGEFQHALAWNPPIPWRSFSATTAASGARRTPSAKPARPVHSIRCHATSRTSTAVSARWPRWRACRSPSARSYTLMAGLGVNGAAGVKELTRHHAIGRRFSPATAVPVAIDPTDSNNWYVNDRPGRHLSVLASLARARPIRLRHDSCRRAMPTSAGDGYAMASARTLPGRPARLRAVADRHLPRLARPANGIGWGSGQRHQPHPR